MKKTRHLSVLDYKEENGLTYAELGELFSVKPSTVHHWVVGNHKPSLRKACEIILKTAHDISFKALGLE